MLPFILGLIGIFFHYKKDVKGFSVVALLFFLNRYSSNSIFEFTCYRARERDYIYGWFLLCFLRFGLGFGVLAVASLLERAIKKPKVAAAVAGVICLIVPGIMASEGWDDHDRSDRYFSVDAARNYLASCEPNSILFTGGDNDTFPLWFVQEVEGFRTDVRVIVFKLL